MCCVTRQKRRLSIRFCRYPPLDNIRFGRALLAVVTYGRKFCSQLALMSRLELHAGRHIPEAGGPCATRLACLPVLATMFTTVVSLVFQREKCLAIVHVITIYA